MNIIALSPSGEILAIRREDLYKNKAIEMWDTRTGKLLYNLGDISSTTVLPGGWRLSDGKSFASGKVTSPDSKLTASNGATDQVNVYYAKDGKLLYTFDLYLTIGDCVGGGANSLAFTPDSAILASAWCDSIQFWCMDGGKLIYNLKEKNTLSLWSWGLSDGIVFSRDGSILAVQGWKEIHSWKISYGAR
jgi:hypothetical protein